MQNSDSESANLSEWGVRRSVIKSAGLRLCFYTAVTLVIVLCFYYIAELTGKNKTVGSTVILAIPIFIGAFIAYLSEVFWEGSAYKSAAFVGFSVFGLGVIFLQEAVVCVIMLAVIWWPLLFLGAFIVTVLLNNAEKRGRTYSLSVLALPIFTLIIDATIPMPIEARTVSRDILIQAPVSKVWAQLYNIADIKKDEGQWNITQDVLGIPRPVGVQTRTAKGSDIRTSYWDKAIRFEEHIIEARPNEILRWDFVFPDDSLRHKIDPHLDPSSHYFHIDKGEYALSAVSLTTTRLTLKTHYIMQTPVNGYSALWGEFFLGDIQNNALKTVKTRTESQLH